MSENNKRIALDPIASPAITSFDAAWCDAVEAWEAARSVYDHAIGGADKARRTAARALWKQTRELLTGRAPGRGVGADALRGEGWSSRIIGRSGR